MAFGGINRPPRVATTNETNAALSQLLSWPAESFNYPIGRSIKLAAHSTAPCRRPSSPFDSEAPPVLLIGRPDPPPYIQARIPQLAGLGPVTKTPSSVRLASIQLIDLRRDGGSESADGAGEAPHASAMAPASGS